MTDPQDNDDAKEATTDWPDLFIEATEMTICSILVFAMADLRRLARDKKLQDPSSEQEILQLPMKSIRMHELWDQNRDALTKARIRSSDYAEVVEPYFFSDVTPFHREGFTIRHVGDENASDECVYVIATDAFRKRIVLAFRGSITVKDWIQDAKTVMGYIPNPARDMDPNQPEQVGVHLGFRDYLYGESPSLLSISNPLANKEETTENDTKPTKVDSILSQLRALKEEHPDYNIYLAGHSLGGALAIIVALEAAAAFEGVVSCITIGNPKTGNFWFRSAIGLMEKKHRLRCLGIHNWMDMVPMLPENVFHIAHNFCHVGFEMKLHRHSFDIVYRGPDTKRYYEWCRRFACWRDCAALWKPDVYKSRMNLHNYREYLERLLAQKGELKKLSLSELYNEELDVAPYK